MKALFWAAVINGVVAVPLMMAAMMSIRLVMAMAPRVMASVHMLSPVLCAMGKAWLCTAVMAVAVAIMFATW